MSHRKSDLGIPRTQKICQSSVRAKARGLKIPDELIISRRTGVSLVRDKNVRIPVPGRDEIVRSFSGALTAFQKEGGRS
jgi:hypothetical protein